MLVPSTWEHTTAFVQKMYEHFFKDLLKTPSAFWGASVVQMQTPDVAEVLDGKHLATLKVDGERQLLVLFVEKTLAVRAFVLCRNGQVMDVVAPGFVELAPSSSMRPGQFTILDTEYYAADGMWLAFDCIMYASMRTFHYDFTKRIEHVKRTVTSDFVCPYVFVKPYFEVERRADFTASITRRTSEAIGLDFRADGIVFQPKAGPYSVGGNMNLATGRGLKWKPECTLDLIPVPMTIQDLIPLIPGGKMTRRIAWDRMIRPASFFAGSSKTVVRSLFDGVEAFKVPPTLHKLKCVSDFTCGAQPVFQVIELDGVPVCADLSPESAGSVYEFRFNADLVPEVALHRKDKALHQANKARTVAGVFWQARNGADLDVLLTDPSKIAGRVEIPAVTTVSDVENRQRRVDFRGFVQQLSHDFVENEFKLVQTKRPRAGMIFPGKQEPCVTNAPFVDVLHFDRIKNLFVERTGHEPKVVTTIDFIVDSNLRVTFNERVEQTRTGKPICFYETSSFDAMRKMSAGASYVLDMPAVEQKSGYVFRLDSRSERLEPWSGAADFVPDNPAYYEFLKGITEKQKKRGAVQAYHGFRLVDKYEFEPETCRGVKVDELRRMSQETVQVGESVQARFRNFEKFHDAEVTSVNKDGTVNLKFKYNVRQSSHTRQDLIPIIVDACPDKPTVLRVKKRQTFNFRGFRVDLTRTKTIHNFKSTDRRRLWHMVQRCDNCEVEVELNRHIDGHVPDLERALVDIFGAMNLSENSFLFDCANVTAAKSEILQTTLARLATFIHGEDIADVDPVFLRAIRGVSRIVRESDFHAMFDAVADEALGPAEPLAAPVPPVPAGVDLVFARNPWVERDAIHITDYYSRRVFAGVCKGPNADFWTRGLLLHTIGNNPCWKDPEAFRELCRRVRGMEVLLTVDVEDVTGPWRDALAGAATFESVADFHRFFASSMFFGASVSEALTRVPRAAWDPQEIALVWNDILDFAHRFANSLFFERNSSEMWLSSDRDVNYFLVNVAFAKLGVLMGAIGYARTSAPPTCPCDITTNLFALPTERCKYARRGKDSVPIEAARFAGLCVSRELF